MEDLKVHVRRQIEHYNAQNLSALSEGYAADAEMTWPGLDPIKGRPAVTEFWTELLAAFPDGKVTIARMVQEGNAVVVEYQFSGTNTGPLRRPNGELARATRKRVIGSAIAIATIHDGKTRSQHQYFDRVEVLTQLGLMPAPASAQA